MGFTHVIHFGQMTGFMNHDWFRYVAQLTHAGQLMDFTLRLTRSHESLDKGHQSHRVGVEGRTPI